MGKNMITGDLAKLIQRLDQAAYLANDDPTKEHKEAFDAVLAELLTAVGVSRVKAGEVLAGGYNVACLIADSIREKMGWDGAGVRVIIPDGWGSRYAKDKVRDLAVITGNYDDGNVSFHLGNYAKVLFVNGAVADSFGVGIIADLLLADIHREFLMPFYFCMKFGGAT